MNMRILTVIVIAIAIAIVIVIVTAIVMMKNTISLKLFVRLAMKRFILTTA